MRQDFSPFSDTTKSINERTKYWNAVHSICELVNQVDEVQQQVENSNSSAETTATQAIVDSVLNDACQWVSDHAFDHNN